MTIYPGDSLEVILIDYNVTEYTFRREPHVFDQIVRATLYVPTFPPKVVEKSIRDLQIF